MSNPFAFVYFAILRFRNARRRRQEQMAAPLLPFRRGELIPLKGHNWVVGDLRPPTKHFDQAVLILWCASPTRRGLKKHHAALKRYFRKRGQRVAQS